MDSINQKRQQYEAAGLEYEKYYFDERTGGYVLIHQGHNRNEGFESEVSVAKAFARRGYQVELVNEQGEEGQRQFDALVNGEPWEFKELTSKARNVKNAIQKGIKIAKYQAPRIAYHINREADTRLINAGIKNALFWDDDQKITLVAVVRSGTLQVLSREDIDNGKLFG
ncbi:hypothetical protein [Synechococcus sp. PCC 6312]|uniref:CdiA C-terminal domain-containing protein n=1 Tax=Synechococcus sp. (strain ATCC 27167 / PCC 6312) TaxID=195253 RepID=UPI00029F1C21|nr:hypothetical protein [Synechococcus sp. PCC 6312]AFY60196.1 hypothetical protein Syn6312_0996 [Synechococcus sp. PCC 6312]